LRKLCSHSFNNQNSVIIVGFEVYTEVHAGSSLTDFSTLKTAFFSVIISYLFSDFYVLFYSVLISQYNSKIIIRSVYYDMFRPLFLAFIKQYLYSPSQLSVIPTPLANVYNLGKVISCLQCSTSVINVNKYCKLYKFLS
jgi:hypothetical protein